MTPQPDPAKIAADKAAAALAASEKAAADKAAAELAAEKAAADKAAADKATADKAAADKAAADKALADKQIAEKAAADKAAADKLAAEKVAADKAAAEKLIADKAAADKAAAEKVAADKAAADKARAEAAKAAAEKAKADAAKAVADKAAADKAKADAAKAEADRIKAEAERSKAEQARIAALEVPDPSFKTTAGVYADAVSVAIEVALKEALIVYTLDGSEPTAKATRYSVPIKLGQSGLIRAKAYVPGGKESAVINADYAIGEVFAAPGGRGQGTRGSPYASVSDAVKKALALNLPIVKVASGSFDDNVDVEGPLVLSGGWKADFSGLAAERSLIKGKAVGSSTKKAPSYALKIGGKTADKRLKVSRFELRGGEASYSSGILVSDGASPDISDCVAYGGSASYGYGVVVLSGASPTFSSSRFEGGEGATSYGLSLDSARANINACVLLAGDGSVGGYGLSATGSTIIAKDSVMAAKAANINNGAAFYDSKDSTLTNCTIVGGSGKEANGIFISASSPAIDNCIITASGSAKSYGIVANYGESSPAHLVGSVFIACSGGFYYEASTKTAYTAFDATGRPLTKEGAALAAKVKAEGNSAASFALGAAPLFAPPGTDANGKGSPLR